MTDHPQPEPGTIAWIDLTVPHVEQVRGFCRDVAGWEPSPVSMGANAALPAHWIIMYIVVSNLESSVERCRELGGTVLIEPRRMGDSTYCIIQDPAGAVCALYQP
jgi:predicted enzyme related to lactoylglutathione lyase